MKIFFSFLHFTQVSNCFGHGVCTNNKIERYSMFFKNVHVNAFQRPVCPGYQRREQSERVETWPRWLTSRWVWWGRAGCGRHRAAGLTPRLWASLQFLNVKATLLLFYHFLMWCSYMERDRGGQAGNEWIFEILSAQKLSDCLFDLLYKVVIY